MVIENRVKRLERVILSQGETIEELQEAIARQEETNDRVLDLMSSQMAVVSEVAEDNENLKKAMRGGD
jgi:uncharacterized coiled-coil protein SlyX